MCEGLPREFYSIIDNNNRLYCEQSKLTSKIANMKPIIRYSKSTAKKTLNAFQAKDSRARRILGSKVDSLVVCKVTLADDVVANSIGNLYVFVDNDDKYVVIKSSSFIYPYDKSQYRFYYTPGQAKGVYSSNLTYRKMYPWEKVYYHDEVPDISMIRVKTLNLTVSEVYK